MRGEAPLHRLAFVHGWLAVASGCAMDLPALPSGDPAFADSSGGATPDASDDTDAGSDGDAETGAATASADEPTGATDGPGTLPGSDDTTADDGPALDESTGAVAETTGGSEAWYAGAYDGSWDGDCPPPLDIAGSGTWHVDIDADGHIEGWYEGTFDGTIVGDVDEQGNTEATATGPQLDECNWDGIIEGNGSAQGTLDCAFDCAGDWSGAKS